jgi:hypothetical protein
MARYIDADVLHIRMEDLYEHHIEMKNFSADAAVADCLDLLDDTPTADVVESPAFWEQRGDYRVIKGEYSNKHMRRVQEAVVHNLLQGIEQLVLEHPEEYLIIKDATDFYYKLGNKKRKVTTVGFKLALIRNKGDKDETN